MEATLRPIGNSAGITLPAQVLRDLSAQLGDIIELQITNVTRQSRPNWNNPTTWQGADQASAQMLEGVAEPAFDTQEWKW